MIIDHPNNGSVITVAYNLNEVIRRLVPEIKHATQMENIPESGTQHQGCQNHDSVQEFPQNPLISAKKESWLDITACIRHL